MRRAALMILASTAACGSTSAPTTRSVSSERACFRETFSETAIEPEWIATTPKVMGGGVRLEQGAVRLTLPANSDGEVTIRHKFDVSRVRGHRLRLVARVRTDAPARSQARATVTVTTDHALPSYADSTNTHAINSAPWVNVHTVIDIAPDATAGELALVLNGAGNAWFDDVALTIVGVAPPPVPIQLTPQQVDNLVTFTRAVALVRYLHPADQTTALDWDEFIPATIDRILRARGQAELLDDLRFAFSAIAPTLTLTTTAEGGVPPTMPRDNATHLARWRHYGLGPSSPYVSYREGRDAEEAFASESTRVHFSNPEQCRTMRLRATANKAAGAGTASLFVKLLRPGTELKDIEEPITNEVPGVTLTTDLPRDTQEVELGVRMSGRASLQLEALTLTCEAGPQPTVDLAHGAWRMSGLTNLYKWEADRCGTGSCATLRGNPLDTGFVPGRDLLTTDIGSGLRLHLPLAVWADDTQTLPIPVGSPPHGDFTINDPAMRLAAISAVWGTLSIFYPYFQDQHTNWLAVLPGALAEAAAARAPQETHTALAHLVAHLRDNHARVTHPATPITGVLPIAFRRFGDKVIVIGGLRDYMETIVVGSELVALDGISAIQAYARASAQVSAATDGLRDYLAPIRMSVGPPGTFRHVRIRSNDGKEIERVLPLVSRDLYDHSIRDARPKPGAELTPGVYYVDFDELSREAWTALLPQLQRARAIIFDFRGYTTGVGFMALAHITDHELQSPEWQIPQLPSTGSPEYLRSHWSIRPLPPRLNVPIVALIDGQSMSAVETTLQIFRENKLGYVVGETSGGTNGNVNTFLAPGGFNIRFTGMRVAWPDGSTIQGHGILPDQVVHPTLEGVRAGRDEILEAGIAAAQRLAPR
jgi:Peptidase family S41